MKDEQTSWTSVDLYYKGVHIKKSVPDNIKIDLLKETIDDYLNAGFKPSWNEDTNKQSIKTPTDPNATMCGIHNVPMSLRPAGVSKTTGKHYPAFWSCPNKNPDGSFCKFKPQPKLIDSDYNISQVGNIDKAMEEWGA